MYFYHIPGCPASITKVYAKVNHAVAVTPVPVDNDVVGAVTLLWRFGDNVKRT
jgi:hypothetical protein